MAFDEFKGPLTLFAPYFLVFSYSYHYEIHATTYDKLVRIKMVICHLPQFEQEPFWQYLSRLNDYRAQYVHFMHEKLKIYNVALEGIRFET